MSMSCTLLVKEIPSRADLQSWLDKEELKVILQKSWQLHEYGGFAPMRLGGYKAGVEIYISDRESDFLSEQSACIGDRQKIISLCFSGSDDTASCCAYAIAAALVKYGDAIAYGEIAEPMSYEQLKQEYERTFVEAKRLARNTPHKLMVEALAEQLPGFKRKGNFFFYMPIGECVRGIILTPKGSRFHFTIFDWPLVAYLEQLYLMTCPDNIGLKVSPSLIWRESTGRWSWEYDESTVGEIVEMVNNNLVPYFNLIEDPYARADSYANQYKNAYSGYDCEKTAMACAAVGKYEIALVMLDRVAEKSQPTMQFDWLVAQENRCSTIANLIRTGQYDAIATQLAAWRKYTIKRLNLSGMMKNRT